MHEDIIDTVLWRNEAVALVGVKPLYCSCNHGNTSVWLNHDGLQFIPGSNIAGVTVEKQAGTPELSTLSRPAGSHPGCRWTCGPIRLCDQKFRSAILVEHRALPHTAEQQRSQAMNYPALSPILWLRQTHADPTHLQPEKR
jgi:hypothetical protein